MMAAMKIVISSSFKEGPNDEKEKAGSRLKEKLSPA